MSMTSSRFWLGLRKSQLPATQWLLHAPSETAALLPVSKTTRPFGWSMTHMLIGIVMSRAFSFGIDGISPWMLNGPNMPLVVQNTFTCANAADGTMHSMPSTTAAIPSFLMGVVSSVVVRGRTHPCARPLDPLARANIARRRPTCQEQGRPCLCECLDPLPPTAGSWKNPQRGRSILTSGNSVKCRDRRGTERRSEEWVRRSAGRFARGRRLRLGAPRRSLVGRRASPAHGQPEAEPAVDLPEAAVTAAERRVRCVPPREGPAPG